MRLYLVRHGQTAWNILGQAQGQTDIPLDEVGLAQRDRLETAFAKVRLDRIYCSDLMRAMQTAEALVKATAAPIEYRSDLRERGFGQWEGRSFLRLNDWVKAEALRRNVPITSVRPPGGESYVDLWDRTAGFVEQISTSDDTVAVVAHGGTCAVMLAQLIKGTPETSRSFRLGNTSVFELERREDGYFSFVRLNDTSHLSSASEQVPVPLR